MPDPPTTKAHYKKGDLLTYHITGQAATVHFPRFGQIRLDLTKGTTKGKLIAEAVDSYNILEDMVAIGLSPHLRRRGMFLVHGFAASYDGRGILIIGPIASGKTTTGIALLDNGWKLLSNDSPIISQDGRILRYPGMLTANPDTFARFEATSRLLNLGGEIPRGKKLAVPAEKIWPSIWTDQANPVAIFFPHIDSQIKPDLTPLKPVESLRRILPQAVEQWDQKMIPSHLQILSRLVEKTSSYTLHLGKDIRAVVPLLRRFVK